MLYKQSCILFPRLACFSDIVLDFLFIVFLSGFVYDQNYSFTAIFAMVCDMVVEPLVTKRNDIFIVVKKNRAQ